MGKTRKPEIKQHEYRPLNRSSVFFVLEKVFRTMPLRQRNRRRSANLREMSLTGSAAVIRYWILTKCLSRRSSFAEIPSAIPTRSER
jgi:hypothetical protein